MTSLYSAAEPCQLAIREAHDDDADHPLPRILSSFYRGELADKRLCFIHLYSSIVRVWVQELLLPLLKFRDVEGYEDQCRPRLRIRVGEARIARVGNFSAVGRVVPLLEFRPGWSALHAWERLRFFQYIPILDNYMFQR